MQLVQSLNFICRLISYARVSLGFVGLVTDFGIGAHSGPTKQHEHRALRPFANFGKQFSQCILRR